MASSYTAKDILVLENDPERRAFAAKTWRCRAVASLKEALALRPSAAVICTPPALHAPAAVKLASISPFASIGKAGQGGVSALPE